MQVLALYTTSCHVLLQQAVEMEERLDESSDAITRMGIITKSNKSRYADSSSDESQNELYSSSSSSSLEHTDNEEQQQQQEEDLIDSVPSLISEDISTTNTTEQSKLLKETKKKKKPTKAEMTLRQREQAIQKHFDSLTCEFIPLPHQKQMKIPSALLSKYDTTTTPTTTLYNVSVQLQQSKPIVVFALRSGRFAGAVFQEEKCLIHTTRQRYTVRRGQGKAQSSQDNSGAAPKSMGAQLRRHGEVQLQNDIRQTIQDWKDYIQSAVLIFISCPKTMKRQLFVESLEADDKRIRRVPLDMGRPSFEAVSMIHAILMRVVILENTNDDEVTTNTTSRSTLSIESDDTSIEHLTKSKETKNNSTKPVDEDTVRENILPKPSVIELTQLHIAARDGDIHCLEELFKTEDYSTMINQMAGEDCMTPLHYAAQSDATTASACVMILLEKGKANPCKLDKRNRAPYYLASHDKVRDAFRMCRASLGEDFCAWDSGAKVGPPLTQEDLQSRKEKEAEKRRRKKARQKEKQAKEKAQAAQAEQTRMEEEARQKEEEEAKRVRDGLAPKKGGGNVCDFCQKLCRKKSQMFQRLSYSYCSTDCVNKHKRELMASAALARF